MPVPAGLRRCYFMLLIWRDSCHILDQRNRHEQDMLRWERSIEMGWCNVHPYMPENPVCRNDFMGYGSQISIT